jgi:hypothetical protein
VAVLDLRSKFAVLADAAASMNTCLAPGPCSDPKHPQPWLNEYDRAAF